MIKYTRRFGDRYDGYRVKNVDPFFFIIPQVMSERVDSQVYFSDEIDITALERFVREHANSDIPGLKLYHVVIAACIRLAAIRPYFNRFVAGRRIFQRNYLSVSMAIKRHSDREETTTLKIPFDPKDTLLDVTRKFNQQVEDNKTVIDENGTDHVAKVLGHMPTFLLTAAIRFLRMLERHGRLPKIINRVSPFHTSFFLTNMGSLGVPPIYHHIYEFGTTSIFLAMGNKHTRNETDLQGNLVSRRKMGIKVVANERICDGAYYAAGMRMLNRLLKNPQALLTPPEQVLFDDGVLLKGRKPYEAEVSDRLEFF